MLLAGLGGGRGGVEVDVEGRPNICEIKAPESWHGLARFEVDIALWGRGGSSNSDWDKSMDGNSQELLELWGDGGGGRGRGRVTLQDSIHEDEEVGRGEGR